MNEIDAVLEEIATKLEEPCLLDLAGIAAKRKRVREDAELRMEVRRAQRRESAEWVRSFKSGQGNSHTRFLRQVADGSTDGFEWGPEVAAAILEGLVTLTVEMDLSTHLLNCDRRFRFALTDSGKKKLEYDSAPTVLSP